MNIKIIYFALKVETLNIGADFLKLFISFDKMPLWLLRWFQDRYFYNLKWLCILTKDKESLEKLNKITEK